MQSTPLALALAVPLVASLGLIRGPALPDLLVSSYSGGSVLRFGSDGSPAGSLGALGSVPGAQSLVFAPDGSLLVASEVSNRVLRFDGVTGAPLGVLVEDDPLTPADETGGLNGPTGAIVGPDGNLYVASFNTDDVLRYDGTTGAFLGTFVAAGSGGLNGPDAGLTFGPDGRLYVPSFFSNRVLRFDENTGAFLGVFAGGLGLPLSRPRVVRFRGDGVAYVTSWGNGRVLRFKPDGSLLDTFSLTATPAGLMIDPLSGDVFTTSDNADHVLRFDGSTKALVGTVVPAGTAGLDGATFVATLPDVELRLGRPSPGTAGVVNSLAIRGATPGASVLFLIGLSTQPSPLLPCAKKWIGVAAPLVFPLVADANGAIDLAGSAAGIPPGLVVAFQAVELASCRSSNLVVDTF